MCDCETYSLPPSLPPSFYPHLPTPLVPQKKEILRKEKKEKKDATRQKKVIINFIKKKIYRALPIVLWLFTSVVLKDHVIDCMEII